MPTATGQPRRHRGQCTGAALCLARLAKERTYPELLGAGRSRVVVLGLEIGGRGNHESITFISHLAKNKQACPTSPQCRYHRVDFGMGGSLGSLPCALSPAVSSSLPASASTNVDGPCPPLCDVLTSYTLNGGHMPSRLPALATIHHPGLSTAGPWSV